MTATGWTGTLLHIHITPAKSQPMQRLEQARLTPGPGIEGDRYALGTGTYSIKPGEDRQVTLIEAEGAERPHLTAFLDAWGEASNNKFLLGD